MIEPMREFATFMDTDKMKAVLQQHLPDCKLGTWIVNDCSIQHPRYKTYLKPESVEKSCLSLAYHLRGKNLITNQQENKILYAQAYLGRRSQSEFLKNQEDINSANPGSLIHIPDLGMIGWTFPFDPVLTWLPKLMEPSNCLKHFSKLGIYKPETHSDELVKVTPYINNYRPKIRCTIRYVLNNKSGQESEVFGKSYGDTSGLEIYLRIKALWQRSLNNCESFVIAKPLCFDNTLHTVWQQGLAGIPLLQSITATTHASITTKIAKGLAELHQLQLPNLKIITHDEQLAEAHKKSSKLIAAFPGNKIRLSQLMTALEKNKPKSATTKTLIHGDFHLQQLLLLDTGRIALFDFDELAIGEPLQDLANFSADLYNHHFDRQQIHDLIVHLVNAYQAETQINTEHFDWHLRLQLLTRAYRAYIQQKPNLEQLINQFLEAAECGYVSGHRDQPNVKQS